jgi:hypothetical protein
MGRKQGWRRAPLVVLWNVLALGPAAAQEVTINGLVAPGVSATLNITVDVIEYRHGNDAWAHLTTGKKHYGLAVVSRAPLPQLDAELLLPPMADHDFTVSIEDGRTFTGCLVTGLKSVGPDTAPRLSYALTCESMSLPPLQCATGCLGIRVAPGEQH